MHIIKKNKKNKGLVSGSVSFRRQLPLYLMLLVPAVFVLVFSYGSMAGVVMAFQDYIPGKGWYVFGSPFVGLENFRQLFNLSNVGSVLYNTVFIAVTKIICGLVFGVLLALMLNEMRSKALKRGIQTAIFFPYFLSWVIVSGMLVDLLDPAKGPIAQMLAQFGVNAPFFLADEKWFPIILVLSDLWKGLGYGAIVYLAAITGVDQTLYEAATIDGAGHVKKAIHITLPGIMPVIILMSVLSLGNVLNAGFEQVFNLYSPVVYSTGDILDTFVYRLGISEGQYSLSAAVGLFKSIISFSLISIAYFIAYRVWDYKIF